MPVASLRSCGIGLALATLSACFAGPVDRSPHASEDDLRTRPVPVDTTLPDVDAISYALELEAFDVARHETFAATVEGSYVVTGDLTELALDFDGNTIDDVEIDGVAATHRRDGATLVIALPAPVARGAKLTSRVRYHGDVVQADGANANDFSAFGGLNVRQRNADGKRIYSSINWPSKARRWLPLRDHPRDGATFATKLTFPASFTVLSNGKPVSRTENPNGTSTWVYDAPTPMPTYDFHVAAYEDWTVVESRSASGVPVRTYSYASARSAENTVYGDLTKALDYYEGAFGPYRWGTASFLEVPIFGGGMEHASVVSMDETLFGNLEEARTTAIHELAHHWSGNLVRIRTWNDFWLSEGFTEYLTARFLGANDGPEAKAKAYRDYLQATLAADAGAGHPVRPSSDRGSEIDVLSIFDAISYQKGALVLRALEPVVGETELATFLKGWFDRHAFAAVTTADFQAELERATGKDLSKFFAGFVFGVHHPEVRVTFSAQGSETEVTVEQLQTKGPAEGFAFPLAVDLVGDAGETKRVTVELTSKLTTKRFSTTRATRSIVVDADETMLGTVVCGAGTGDCKAGFRCLARPVSVCVPL